MPHHFTIEIDNHAVQVEDIQTAEQEIAEVQVADVDHVFRIRQAQDKAEQHQIRGHDEDPGTKGKFSASDYGIAQKPRGIGNLSPEKYVKQHLGNNELQKCQKCAIRDDAEQVQEHVDREAPGQNGREGLPVKNAQIQKYGRQADVSVGL